MTEWTKLSIFYKMLFNYILDFDAVTPRRCCWPTDGPQTKKNTNCCTKLLASAIMIRFRLSARLISARCVINVQTTLFSKYLRNFHNIRHHQPFCYININGRLYCELFECGRR